MLAFGQFQADLPHGVFGARRGDHFYLGMAENGSKHGPGKSVDRNKVFEGVFSHDMCHGPGRLFAEGLLVEGTFFNGHLHDRCVESDGRLTSAATYCYGVKQGWSTVKWHDGQLTCKFSKGVRDGVATLKLGGNEVMRFTYTNGHATGFAVKQDNHGRVFEGYLLEGLLEGPGRETNNKTVFEGEFSAGIRSGIGIEWSLDGSKYYAGEWRDGQRQGRGVERGPGAYLYFGDWERGFKHGLGYERLDDFREYYGSFVEGRHEGHADVKMADLPQQRVVFEDNSIAAFLGPGNSPRMFDDATDFEAKIEAKVAGYRAVVTTCRQAISNQVVEQDDALDFSLLDAAIEDCRERLAAFARSIRLEDDRLPITDIFDIDGSTASMSAFSRPSTVDWHQVFDLRVPGDFADRPVYMVEPLTAIVGRPDLMTSALDVGYMSVGRSADIDRHSTRTDQSRFDSISRPSSVIDVVVDSNRSGGGKNDREHESKEVTAVQTLGGDRHESKAEDDVDREMQMLVKANVTRLTAIIDSI